MFARQPSEELSSPDDPDQLQNDQTKPFFSSHHQIIITWKLWPHKLRERDGIEVSI
jgi:hypothetical protein